MEVTNEIKAKVFAQYLGQKGISEENGEVIFYAIEHPNFAPKEAEYHIGTFHKHFGHNDETIESFKLLLKPLSSITDEDAIEVAKICSIYNQNEIDLSVARHGDRSIVYNRKQEESEHGETKVNIIHKDFEINHKTENGYSWPDTYRTFEIYQFLQSKGYDLPNYLLNGKTLHEVGLAIYD